MDSVKPEDVVKPALGVTPLPNLRHTSVSALTGSASAPITRQARSTSLSVAFTRHPARTCTGKGGTGAMGAVHGMHAEHEQGA